MIPLLLYALFAGGLGWSVSKKKWGAVAFFGAMMLWMLFVQIVFAVISAPHPINF